MNPERLHDALNLLEEDLIAPVEKLRRRRTVRWPHLAALAACLTVVCVLGLYGFGLFDGAQTNDTAQELGVALEHADEENLAERKDTLPPKDLTEETDSSPQSVISEDQDTDHAANIPLSSAVLRIERIENDRFTAAVLQSEGTPAEGSRVTVLLTEDTTFALGDRQEASWPTDGQVLYEGASVTVFFVPGPEEGSVYATVISFAE